MNKEELESRILVVESEVNRLFDAIDSADCQKQHELVKAVEIFGNLLEEYSKL